MVQASSPKTSRQKVQAHREWLRAQGLRPIQIWAPDVRAPTFLSKAHQQYPARDDGGDFAAMRFVTNPFMGIFWPNRPVSNRLHVTYSRGSL